MKKIFHTLVAFCLIHTVAGQNATPQPVNINTDYVEYSPTISGDGKTMVFQSNRDGGFRLYESALQKDGSWSAPQAIENINKFARPNYLIGGPCLSQDGKTLYLCMMLYGAGSDMDIYVSKKNSKNEWGAPANIGRPVTTPDSETFPSISPDGKKIFYTLTPVKGREQKCSKIMMSEADAKGNWTKPVEVAAPLNASCDKSPRLAYDNKTLLYASSKNGNYDLFSSELSSTNTWSQPVALDYLNSGDAQSNPSLLSNEEYIYYSEKGDIYFTPVPDQYRLHGLGLSGNFVDVETGKPVTGKVFLIDSLAKDTVKKIDVTGTYKVNVPAGKWYTVAAVANGYYNYSAAYNPSIDERYKAQPTDIKLKPKRKEIVFKVSDKDNSKGLKVKIKVTNTETKEETIIEASSGRDGKYAVSLREGNKYNVEVSSIEGYAYTSTVIDVPLTEGTTAETLYASGNRETDSTTATDVYVPDFDIKMQPLKDNTKLTLNDILFSFNQYTLDPKSYVELDKVASLMKSNPSAIVEISAHTDDKGSDEYNNTLSTKRAQEIVKYLTSKGVHASKLRAKGYGKTRPLDTADSEEARAKNRRVELKILDIK